MGASRKQRKGGSDDTARLTTLRIARQADHLDVVCWMIDEYMVLDTTRGECRDALSDARSALEMAAHHMRRASELVVEREDLVEIGDDA